MPSIPSIKRGRVNLWSGMKKAGIANAPCPSLEAPGKSVNHTEVLFILFFCGTL